MDCQLQVFGGLRGSPVTSLWWQIQSFTSLRWDTWIIVFKLLVAYWWLLVACVDRCVKAFGGIRGLSITSLWWFTLIAVHKPLVADGVVYKPLVAYVYYRE